MKGSMRLILIASSAFALSLALQAVAQAAPAAHDMANMPGMDHSSMAGMAAMPGMDHPAQPDAAAQPAASAAHDMADMPGMTHEGHAMPYSGVQGFYPMARDASGTSWQPDASPHAGIHGASGRWSTMVHAAFNAVYDRQTGPRGDDKAFLAGMVR